MRKVKTYVLMISKVFPGYHPRKGQPTRFKEKILLGEKIHTIRGNYELWKKRVEEVNAGRAVISLRQWKDKPYRSKQEEFMRLEKAGVQNCIIGSFICDNVLICKEICNNYQKVSDIARNDGLLEQDFRYWFSYSKFDTDIKETAIIHFTNFKY